MNSGRINRSSNLAQTIASTALQCAAMLMPIQKDSDRIQQSIQIGFGTRAQVSEQRWHLAEQFDGKPMGLCVSEIQAG